MSKAKQIVFFKRDLSANGGLEKHTWLLANRFAQNGYHPTILCEKKASPPQSSTSINYISSEKSERKRITRTQKLHHFDRFCSNYFYKNRPDIAFGLDRTSHQTHIRAGNGVHKAYLSLIKPIQSTLHSLVNSFHPFHRKILQIEKHAFENPSLKRLFTNSQMVKKQILHYYSTDPDKISVIHNGVEWNKFQSPFDSTWNEKASFIEQHPFLKDRYHFLFVGHGFYRKGLYPLLKALSTLKGKDFFLSIVGKDKKEAEYKRYAKKLELENQVKFWGPRADVIHFYQAADALVIPSFYDPFANVTIEALAMGLTVVSSKTNGGHEVLTNESGILIDNLLDTDELAHRLATAITKPKTSSSAFGIRDSVKMLDFSHQLTTLVKMTVNDE